MSDQPSQTAESAGAARGKGRSALVAYMLYVAVAVVVVHWPAVFSPVLTFDDDQYLTENLLVQHPGWESTRQFLTEVLKPSTVRGYYQPLSMISLMFDYALGGRTDHLAPFRLTSLALHVLNTLLVILLLYRIFGRPGVAALVGLVFGLHPMTIESIPWIAERKTVLASFFALAALNVYVGYARRGGVRSYAAIVLLFMLAMLSKPTTTPLPAVLLLMDIWPLNRFGRRAILEKLPLFALTGGFAIITYLSQKNASTVVMPGDHAWTHVPFILCHNIIFYLYNMICPIDICWHYPFPRPFTWDAAWVKIGVIGTALLLATVAASWMRTRAFATGWLIFFIAIFPTLGIIGFHPVIAADRHAYLPVIGLLLPLAWMLGLAADRLRYRGAARAALVALLLVAAAGLAFQTRHYYAFWQDNIGFRKYLIARAPDFAPLHDGLGMAYARAGRFDEAIAEFEGAVKGDERDTHILVNWATVLQQRGRVAEAIPIYERALRLSNDLPEAHSNLGDGLLDMGRLDEAVSHLEEALRQRPRFAEALINLGNVRKAQGRYEEAVAAYDQALSLKPHLTLGLRNLASAQRAAGRAADAVWTLRRLIQNNPGSAKAQSDLAAVLRETGSPVEALGAAKRAVELDPTLAAAHYNLGNCLMDAKQPEKAMESFRRALELDAGFVDARVNVANLLASGGRADEAITEYQAVIRDDPKRAIAYNNLAALLEEREKFPEAELNYRKAIEIDPKYLDPHYNYAGLLAKLNRLDAALTELDAALLIDPRSTVCSYLKGNILAHQGRAKEALTAYDAVLAIDPKFEEARAQREALLAANQPNSR